MRIKTLLATLSMVTILSSCQKQVEVTNGTDVQNEKKVVYTSIYPVYSLTEQIAGDKMEVQSFMDLTKEAHDWEPSEKDMAKLEKADLFIINGAGMEEWEKKVKDSTNVEILDLSQNIDKIKADEEHHEDLDHDDDHHHDDAGHDDDHHHDDTDHDDDHHHDDADHEHDQHQEDLEHEHHHHHHGEFDPHLWLSAKNLKVQAKDIFEKLTEMDPADKQYFEENYKKVDKNLDDILNEYTKKFENVKTDKFIVAHQAFGYVARDFNLEQIPLQSLTSTDDASLKRIKEVINLIRKENVNTVFYEKNGSDKSAKTLADETGVKIDSIDTVEFLTEKQLKDRVKIQDIIKENYEKIYSAIK